MAYLYCKDCGTPVAEFASILDVTKEFVAEKLGPHQPSCPRRKITDQPSSLYFSLDSLLKKSS